ncbi:unnamed protein product (mitochondrion) [Plasmodiophora brassicae]|uniref:Uncharacterized protein n=1 Tax=Plasmodiophora brassicae TaxID=37360 RepID=A0A0G4IHX8_PLABS|nr:hypothetical protein PBRA_003631 [Plasmodiophora brassicae]SPQ94156.1 unnamed protein product [Plasmodiophora brassicae]
MSVIGPVVGDATSTDGNAASTIPGSKALAPLEAGATATEDITIKLNDGVRPDVTTQARNASGIPILRRIDRRVLIVALMVAVEAGVFVTLYLVVLPYATDWTESTTILYRGEQDQVHLGWIGVHITSATFVLIIGPVQLALGYLDYGDSTAHRWLGVVYVVAQMFSIPCAFVCSMISRNGALEAWSLFLLDIYWLGTLSMAMYSIKARLRIRAHRDNMIRNYIGALFFATFRIGRRINETDFGNPLILGVAHLVFAEALVWWTHKCGM